MMDARSLAALRDLKAWDDTNRSASGVSTPERSTAGHSVVREEPAAFTVATTTEPDAPHLADVRVAASATKALTALPRRASNRELLETAKNGANARVRNDAAERLRRQVKTLCAATLSRQAPHLSASALEDLTQDVLLRLLSSGSDGEPTPAYIARIAANLLIDQRRHQVRRGLEKIPVSLDATPEEGGLAGGDLIDDTEDVAERALQNVTHAGLHATLARLLKPHEAAIVLRRAEGAAHDEIAHELGMSPVNVRKQYERTLRRLQDHAAAGRLAIVAP